MRDCSQQLETELAHLHDDLERFTGGGLLDCHAICDQRDAAVAERDRLRAKVERLRSDRDCEKRLRKDAEELREDAIAHAERYRLTTLKLDAELAAERARLDSGTILLTVAGEHVWHCGIDLRAAIDAGIKEGAK
jgi:hypothetical protein